MAAVSQEPEITLAQRLASNEKPIRTKALKTLRKYFNLRSQKIEGGFTSEDLLKIWKGLFYCLWMQDKPLLQEEISHKISTLIHSFHTTDTKLLYFTTFLQTVKREWNGIDRLRMDKFYQLVRFMFRQAFEVLKKREWDTSLMNQFLHVFTEQLLQNPENVPKGLMLHILDLYMTELAQVGSTELTAEQNLTFIDPFCKTMAKTKDGLLLLTISKSIFRTILDHAPFAIEDLIRELQQGEGDDSDSGQASGEEEEELKNRAPKKTKAKKVNGISKVIKRKGKGNKEEPDLDDVDSDEDDDGVGPVLQFDYGAVADRLFELGSHLNTRNINRKKLYSLVKAFRTLNEGISDRNEGSKVDLSNTSDNKLSKKKSKKKKRKNESSTTEDESLAKKSKACHDEQKVINPLNNTTEERVVFRDHSQHHHELDSRLKASEMEADVDSVCQQKETDSHNQLQVGVTVKKKRKSKKAKTVSQDGEQEVAQESGGEHQSNCCRVENCAAPKPGLDLVVEAGASLTQEKTKKKNKKKKLNAGEEKTGPEIDGQIVDKQPEVISLQIKTQETEDIKAKAQRGDPGELDVSAVEKNKKRKNKKLRSGLQDVGEVVAVQSLPKEDVAGDEITPQKVDGDNSTTQSQLETRTIQTKTVKRKKSSLKKFGEELKSLAVSEDSEISVHPCPTSEEDGVTQCGLKAGTAKKKKGKRLMADGSSSQEVGEAVDSTLQDSSTEVRSKKNKKKKNATEEPGSKQLVDLDVREPEVSSDSAHITTTPKSKGNTAEPKWKNIKKKKVSSSNEEESTLETKEQPAVEAATPKHTPLKKKKIQNKKESQLADNAREVSGTGSVDTLPSDSTICTPEMKSVTPMKKGKKKRKLQTDEAEMSQSNGHVQEELSGKKVKVSQGIKVTKSLTPKKLKMEKASTKSDFVSFQGVIKPPTPLFCKTKPKVSTPLSSIKEKFQTPKSETKKVTFGLKNNKTAEFRKTDRSLLVSPVGSSRVAFDPKKVPVSGVLKSPSPSPVVKKTPAKKRPTAADFF